ncbi:MAG TPA: beta-L-arabinofuranosidase domain-containing protein [Opitutaceae bacterium]|nr:beta-L-arabinofuranosidase domain-containing protein [Opitutaceae bacterium]
MHSLKHRLRTSAFLAISSGVLVASSLFLSSSAAAAERSLIDTTHSPSAKMFMPDLADVRWQGGLLGERFDVCRDTMVPHLWEIFRDPNESHAWDNFLIAAGLSDGRDGKPHGPPFNDGDFLKWVEALSQIYAVTRDPAIDRQLDDIIRVIAKAQRPDGYLHTPKIILQHRAAAEAAAAKGSAATREFEDRDHFETYNMGHLMTTACIHFRATGKTTLLDCARKAADYLDRLCHDAPADLARNAICPSHYMGVVELYRVTHERRYLELAKQLIEIRRLVPPDVGSDMNQDRVPFRAMTEAVGHAVRANYLFAGVADVFAEDGDLSLLQTLDRLSDNVADKKLYVTGMTGALYDGASPDGAENSQYNSIKTVHQAYGRAYQLPNLTAYNETCATIGFALWQWRMLTATGDARHADLFEQSLYNGVLSGISLEGKDYFYVNPLKKLQDFDVPLRWSRSRMPNIKSSFCCPPNVVRTIAEAHNYVYSLSSDALWVNLYAATTLDTAWLDGSRVKLKQETDYPWSGAVKFTFAEAPAKPITLKLRIPGWLHPGAATLRVNGQSVAADGRASATANSAATPRPGKSSASSLNPGTYAEVTRTWRAGDVVTLDLAFEPVLLEANPFVEETVNQVAVRYGPLIYCAESSDLPAGVNLRDVALALRDAKPESFHAEREKIGRTEIVALNVPALALSQPAWTAGSLYREKNTSQTPREIALKLIPYYAWGNRGESDMEVWLPAR